MNEARKQEWLTALRSGEFRQGQGRLATIESDGTVRHCCLGVACELAVRAGIVSRTRSTDNESDEQEQECYSYSSALFEEEQKFPEATNLPASVVEWLEVLDFDPVIATRYESISLTALNDGSNFSFEEIADLIEEYL